MTPVCRASRHPARNDAPIGEYRDHGNNGEYQQHLGKRHVLDPVLPHGVTRELGVMR
jgi:hypothetical protein